MLCRVNPCLIPSCNQAVFPSEVFGRDFEILKLSTEDHCDTGHSCSPSNPGPHHLAQAWAQGLALPRVAQGPWPLGAVLVAWYSLSCLSAPQNPFHQTRFLVRGRPCPMGGDVGPRATFDGSGWSWAGPHGPR